MVRRPQLLSLLLLLGGLGSAYGLAFSAWWDRPQLGLVLLVVGTLQFVVPLAFASREVRRT